MPENSFEEQEISVTRLRLSDFFMTVQCIRNKSEDKDKRKKRKMDPSRGQLICLYVKGSTEHLELTDKKIITFS